LFVIITDDFSGVLTAYSLYSYGHFLTFLQCTLLQSLVIITDDVTGVVTTVSDGTLLISIKMNLTINMHLEFFETLQSLVIISDDVTGVVTTVSDGTLLTSVEVNQVLAETAVDYDPVT
jgi:hypothetical protein